MQHREIPDKDTDIANPDSHHSAIHVKSHITVDRPVHDYQEPEKFGWVHHPAHAGLDAIQPPISLN